MYAYYTALLILQSTAFAAYLYAASKAYSVVYLRISYLVALIMVLLIFSHVFIEKWNNILAMLGINVNMRGAPAFFPHTLVKMTSVLI